MTGVTARRCSVPERPHPTHKLDVHLQLLVAVAAWDGHVSLPDIHRVLVQAVGYA
jgi:hypothetical protein